MFSKRLNTKSYAKINLGLKVLDSLPDGYHSIITIMQEIDFFDLISISQKEHNKIQLICNGPISVPDDKTNLCYKAAKLIYDNYDCPHGLDISLTKNVPTGAGLGGGSSNAATVLKQLNEIFELKISKNHLRELALEIGCDVPFFIDGGIQLCEGKGEKLTPILRGLLTKSLQVFAIEQASSSTHSPKGIIEPKDSALGMNSLGETLPR